MIETPVVAEFGPPKRALTLFSHSKDSSKEDIIIPLRQRVARSSSRVSNIEQLNFDFNLKDVL